MSTAQSGIFALGSPSHAYLEFDLQRGRDARALIKAMADVREPRTTVGGVNFVSGFRPELWTSVVPDGVPADLTGFNHNLTGPDAYVMPATQHDAVLWLSGGSYDVVFDEARQAINALTVVTTIADEASGWPYRRYRDLSGFVDGTKNPRLLRAADVALVAEGQPGAGGNVLMITPGARGVVSWDSLAMR